MSFLSDLFGLGSQPTGSIHAQRVAANNAKDQAAAQQAAEAQRAQQYQEDVKSSQNTWQSDLDRAQQGGQSSAEDYFRSMGLDPSLYSGDISSAISNTRAGIPTGGNIAGAFSGVGQSVYDNLTNALRSQSLSGVEGLNVPDVADTSDDAIIEKILAEQQGGANDYATNLLKRGVVTDAGFNAAKGDIGRQSDVARGLLSQLGDTLLGGERSSLEGILNSGKEAASTLRLGQSFDPSKYGTDLTSSFDNFMKGLEGSFRTQAPKNLFDTSGLASIAGQAQGPQNLAFAPKAVYGGGEEDQTDEEKSRAATTVF
jgi:hypothetical protein